MSYLLLILCSIFCLSCTKNATSKASSELNLAIWGNYLSPEAQKAFTDKTGIHINVTNYASNEELLAKVQMGSSGLDMAVPSDYMVDVMMKLKLLEPLDKTQIPNFKNISGDFLAQPFDRENTYSIPYAWTTTGIAVNRSLYKGSIKGWKDVLSNPALAGKFSLLDDTREVIGMALKIAGHSVNSTAPAELKEAQELLMKSKKNIKSFTSDTAESIRNKEVLVAQAYSSDALQTQSRSDEKIEFILPDEGGTQALDNLVILKGAKNKENALKLMNELLTPENNLAFALKLRSGPVLKATRAALPKDLQDNPAMFPSSAKMQKMERLHDLGEGAKLYENIWNQLKN